MGEQHIIARIEGVAGRITLNRPEALNALSHEMVAQIAQALRDWRGRVRLVVIDAVGARAFCAGGDIAQVYREGITGLYANGRQFWADEYALNAAIAEYPVPVVAFMQGFVMGGGVGIGGHARHRIVGESTQMAMPECGIGLVPDVGGSYLLGRAPERLGEYYGLTGARMSAGSAIAAGFADRFIPEAEWPALIARMCESGTVDLPELEAPPCPLSPHYETISAAFSRPKLRFIAQALAEIEGEFAAQTLATLRRNCALSMGCTLLLVRAARNSDLRAALTREYRFTYRACEEGEFLEGVRAQIIDKDRNPRWKTALDTLPDEAVQTLLRSLPDGVRIPFWTAE